MNPQVTDYIEHLKQGWQIEVCTQLRQIIHQSIPDVEERIQYGKPHYLKNGHYAVVTGTAKGWVSVTIFNAQALETPEDLFGASKNGDRKMLKIHEGQAVDSDLLAKLIQQASSTI